MMSAFFDYRSKNVFGVPCESRFIREICTISSDLKEMLTFAGKLLFILIRNFNYCSFKNIQRCIKNEIPNYYFFRVDQLDINFSICQWRVCCQGHTYPDQTPQWIRQRYQI